MSCRDGLSRCNGCGLPYNDCPISDEDAEWTTDANGNHDGLCCEDCWHPNDNWQPSPRENPMTAQIITEAENLLHEAAVKLGSIGHTIADDVRSILAKLRGDETTLQAEAVADGEQVLHDAEQAAAPVAAEAEKDATKLAGEAVADVEADVQPPTSA